MYTGATVDSQGGLGCSDVLGWNEPRRDSDVISRENKPFGTIVRGWKKKDTGRNTQIVDNGVGRKLAHLAPSHESFMKVDDDDDDAIGGETTENTDIAGKIVLLTRGGCGFLEKVKWAQRRGGIAVIIGDNIPGGALVTMFARGDTSDITIPALFVTHTTAHLLSSLVSYGDVQDRNPMENCLRRGKASENGAIPRRGEYSHPGTGKVDFCRNDQGPSTAMHASHENLNHDCSEKRYVAYILNLIAEWFARLLSEKTMELSPDTIPNQSYLPSSGEEFGRKSNKVNKVSSKFRTKGKIEEHVQASIESVKSVLSGYTKIVRH